MPTISPVPARIPALARSSRRSSSHARQMSSARYSIFAASRSRSEVCSARPCRSVRQRVVALAELAQQRPVDDQVGIAADRRGEVAVRGAGEPGVAEVRRVVARLLQRPQDERRERDPPATRLRDVVRDRARRSAPASAAASCGASRFGRRRCRHAQVGELREQVLDRLRIGTLVHAVQRLAVRRDESNSPTRSLATDHQLLDQHVRVRLGLEPGVGDLPVGEAKRLFRRLHLQRAAREPRGPPLGREAVVERERAEDLGASLAPLAPAP